ncbi:MAG TPA: type II toxin-antitoxin system VapC family toxin [Verrucomicrobiae bacterium]
MNLLLDTHVFIWLDDNRDKLSPLVIDLCTDRTDTLWLSVVVVWEIQTKLQIGKLKLRGSLAEIIRDQKQVNGIQILALNLPHVMELQNLPAHHKDPFDRMLIAQAKSEDWKIVSKDPEFKTYPVTVVW